MNEKSKTVAILDEIWKDIDQQAQRLNAICHKIGRCEWLVSNDKVSIEEAFKEGTEVCLNSDISNLIKVIEKLQVISKKLHALQSEQKS